MTVNELYRQGTDILNEAQVENSAFDARQILTDILKISSTQFAMCKKDIINQNLSLEYIKKIRQRASGRPLQYIIGNWDFMGNTFAVGEGVLIPRPETELLVELAKAFLLKNPNSNVFDLCAGSGCVGISVAGLFKTADVFCVEKSEAAYAYLDKNIKSSLLSNVKGIKADIFDKDVLNTITPDLILSNPPYIKTNDIPLLQKEVQYEPEMALDGGNDGLMFYKALAEDWSHRLPHGGKIITECGEGQANEIAQMFYLSNCEVSIINDFSGTARVVSATKK